MFSQDFQILHRNPFLKASKSAQTLDVSYELVAIYNLFKRLYLNDLPCDFVLPNKQILGCVHKVTKVWDIVLVTDLEERQLLRIAMLLELLR